jgi:hypothetical protein
MPSAAIKGAPDPVKNIPTNRTLQMTRLTISRIFRTVLFRRVKVIFITKQGDAVLNKVRKVPVKTGALRGCFENTLWNKSRSIARNCLNDKIFLHFGEIFLTFWKRLIFNDSELSGIKYIR